MHTLRLRTHADDAELARLEDELTRRWTDLHPPIVMEWQESSMVALDRGTPWLYGPAECDPLRDHRGRMALPRQPRDRLRALAARGMPFHRIALAHELDPTGPVRDLLPALRHGPRVCDDTTARRLLGPPPVHPGVRRAAGMLDALVGGMGNAAGLLVDAVLDPIVFGVVAPRRPVPGDATLWFPLVAWRW